MRRIVSLLVLMIVPLCAECGDDPWSLTLVGAPVFPVRGLKSLVGIGYEGLGTLEYNINDNIAIGLRGGYLHWRFSNSAINAASVEHGGESGFQVEGGIQAIPVMGSARLTFDGSVIRPYVGLVGGTYMLHWEISGRFVSNGNSVALAPARRTWSEPATTLDLGIRIVLGSQLSIDLGGAYTAFSNVGDRIESADFFGRRLAGENTATSLTAQAGLRFVL